MSEERLVYSRFSSPLYRKLKYHLYDNTTQGMAYKDDGTGPLLFGVYELPGASKCEVRPISPR